MSTDWTIRETRYFGPVSNLLFCHWDFMYTHYSYIHYLFFILKKNSHSLPTNTGEKGVGGVDFFHIACLQLLYSCF